MLVKNGVFIVAERERRRRVNANVAVYRKKSVGASQLRILSVFVKVQPDQISLQTVSSVN